ncbi:precorrin-3B synthase [Pseudomonas coleopterorum]|uniref:Precorrin-3B synthase n=1 Tax=Pseudomonas coleopterorum TaxID=1605838 RepID=A0AAJ6LYN8_9PSED|nr:precorrin-3B synthase [Pseudomonas coleopterorum]WNC09412.1 precorrin-3B synthase [Pseudomonas coleopterorum]
MPSAKAGIIPRLTLSSGFSRVSGAPLNKTSNVVRPSACPGLLRIVQALDGGICRIKLAGGELRADQADAVAEAAERHAEGTIEATNRANLQIRGIGEQRQALIEHLLQAGLGPREAAGDDVRNVMLSPTAGIDPDQVVDTRPLAAQIIHSLETESRFHALSAKFAVQLQGGERLAMLDHHHDLWLSAFERDGQCMWAFGLAGCPGSDAAVGAVPFDQGHALVVAVLEQFLERARPEHTRMRDLLADADALFAGRGLSHPPRHQHSSISSSAADLVGAGSAREEAATDTLQAFLSTLGLPVCPAPLEKPLSTFKLGIQPQRQPGLSFISTLAPLGRLTPAMLRGAAQLARDHGIGTLRMTPWQGLLLPDLHEPEPVLRALTELGFITGPQQPLAAMIACTGASGCAKGLADTKADAVRLAALLPDQAPLSVHLSGCSRSCAAAHVAPATLLASTAGHYDLYLRAAGVPGFGTLLARHLSLDAAAALLRDRSRSDTHD